MELDPAGSDVVVNAPLPCESSVSAELIELPPSRNVTVPVGTVLPDAAETVVVNVTDCPAADGFCDDTMAIFTAAPVDGVAMPVTGMENGLPGAVRETKTFPPVLTPAPVRTSLVGAKEPLIVQLIPG